MFRSIRAEEKEARRYDSHKQKAMEILFAKIQAEFEKEDKGRNRFQHVKGKRQYFLTLALFSKVFVS